MKISVIIPAFKQAAFLSQSIESVLSQTRPPLEIIVVDDGSPDETSEICSRFAGRIQYLKKDNAGVSAARNTGILSSKGTWLQFLDADDILPHDAFEKHFQTQASMRESDVLFAGSYLFGPDGERLSGNQEYALPSCPLETFLQLLLGNNFPPHAALVRRRAIENAGLWDPMIHYFEDWDLWIRLAFSGARYLRTPDLYVGYRHHPGSATKNVERMRNGAMQVLAKTELYAPRTHRVRRAIANGRWNIRRHFLSRLMVSAELSQTGGKEMHADRQRSRMTTLLLAMSCDPWIWMVYLRDYARSLAWAARRGVGSFMGNNTAQHNSTVSRNE